MTVQNLIELLQKCDQQDEVVTFNGEEICSITGITYAGKDHKVELHTDEP